MGEENGVAAILPRLPHTQAKVLLSHRSNSLFLRDSLSFGSFEVVRTELPAVTVDDPFTGGERYEMIKATLLDQGVTPDRYDIIPVGFYRSTPDFLASVVSLSPPFHRVYTANPQVASLFSSWNHEVWPTQSQPTSRLTSGTEVRRKMAANADWEPLVPEAVARVIRRIGGVCRLQLLHSDND